MFLPATLDLKERKVDHLTNDELEGLTSEFMDWFEERQTVSRTRKWLIFLFLRYTGARISEVLQIQDRDINTIKAEVRLKTMKRREDIYRIVPVPKLVMVEYLQALRQYPELTLKLHRSQFFRTFAEICKRCGISKELSHPHVLRHTRAIELLSAGIPITAVKQLLGHSHINTTAVYLRYSNVEIAEMLRQKGLV
ncbi:MAG: site-specific integrase [Candidatus Aenigmatarchaeota archaeon]